MFFIVFAILEKTNLFGDGKKQLNAVISLVVALIFVSAVFPKIVVSNLILFMAVALVVIFIGLLLWGFINNGKVELHKGMGIFLGIVIVVGLVFALIWSTGFGGGIENLFTNIFDFLFNSSWSGTAWTNIIVIALIIGAIAVVLKYKVTGASA